MTWPTTIQTDVRSLRKLWFKKLTVTCSSCGEMHEIAVRETYTDGILEDAAQAFRRA
jgi:RNase P subunit RPR2